MDPERIDEFGVFEVDTVEDDGDKGFKCAENADGVPTGIS
jgi:hypothetical protein